MLYLYVNSSMVTVASRASQELENHRVNHRVLMRLQSTKLKNKWITSDAKISNLSHLSKPREDRSNIANGRFLDTVDMTAKYPDDTQSANSLDYKLAREKHTIYPSASRIPSGAIELKLMFITDNPPTGPGPIRFPIDFNDKI